MEKYKIVTISDHPLGTSGVSLQTRYIIEHLVKTGKFKIISIGAAIKHQNYQPQKVSEWGDDVVIIPCDGFVNQELIRQILDIEKPDCFWIMSDPRFYFDLFRMENEIRKVCPIVWNTIWDNYLKIGDAPRYNWPYYESCDFLGCISKLTYDAICDLGFKDKAKYIPHGVPEDQFSILYDTTQEKLKLQFFGPEKKDSFMLFYNSRNALRKRTGNVIMTFKMFRDSLSDQEKDKVFLAMHTPPKDPEGQDLNRILKDFNLEGSVIISDKKMNPRSLCELYNAADLTISMSSEEGFGLSVLESLMCGTPVLCTKTGGMQDQIIDEEAGRTFGVCVEPHARSFVGSQLTPYIWSDHIDPEKTSKDIGDLYSSWKSNKEEYKERWAGENARSSVLRRFNLADVQKTWQEEIVRTIENFKEKRKSRKVEAVSI